LISSRRQLRRASCRLATAALACAWLASGAALAHPGSGIGIDRQGRIFFVDTGHGVWVVDAEGRVASHDGPPFHWMALDPDSRFDTTRFPGPPAEIRAVGRDPMVILSGDAPLVVGSDGDVYFPELRRDQRLRVVRLTPAGERADFAVLPAEGDGVPLRWLNGMAAGAGGSIYYSENAAVRRIDRRGAVTTVASRVSVPDCARLANAQSDLGPLLRGLAVAPDGTTYVAASACRALLRIAPSGEVEPVLRAEAPWSPTAVALQGNDVLVLEYTHTDTDSEDRRAWVPRVRRLAPDGKVTVVVAIERDPVPAAPPPDG
jgi:sugar lactone lactonase YvrE